MKPRRLLGLVVLLALASGLMGIFFLIAHQAPAHKAPAHKAFTLGKPLPTTPQGETQRGVDYGHHYAKADYWWRKAARQGYSHAEFDMGLAYNEGHGVPKNYAKALYWYRKSAAQGYDGSENNLGALYFDGHGVPKNYQTALYWYRKAAAQGSRIAEQNIALVKRHIARHYEHEADVAYHKALHLLHEANHSANPHVIFHYAGQVANDVNNAFDDAHFAYENAPGTLIATDADIDAHGAEECAERVDHDLHVAREQARFGAVSNGNVPPLS